MALRSGGEGEAGERPGALRGDGEVRQMFGRIVRRYDLMNRLMTGGRDRAWRRRAVRLALDGAPSGAPLLDVATGTGDLALELARAVDRERFVVGIDFAAPMVRAAAAKGGKGVPLRSGGGGGRVGWMVGDALALPFADETFAACTVAFGLRNMANYGDALREMGRVLRPGGRFVCLELTPYRRPILRTLFAWYFSRVVPLVGGLLSGDRDAYRYLPQSVTAFPTADALAGLMRGVGFTNVSYRKVGGGTVALHVGTKGTAP